MVSPVPDERDTKRIKRFSHYGLAHQPVDLREGVAKAYTVVKEVNKSKDTMTNIFTSLGYFIRMWLFATSCHKLNQALSHIFTKHYFGWIRQPLITPPKL